MIRGVMHSSFVGSTWLQLPCLLPHFCAFKWPPSLTCPVETILQSRPSTRRLATSYSVASSVILRYLRDLSRQDPITPFAGIPWHLCPLPDQATWSKVPISQILSLSSLDCTTNKLHSAIIIDDNLCTFAITVPSYVEPIKTEIALQNIQIPRTNVHSHYVFYFKAKRQ